jgi:hypothetical protein
MGCRERSFIYVQSQYVVLLQSLAKVPIRRMNVFSMGLRRFLLREYGVRYSSSDFYHGLLLISVKREGDGGDRGGVRKQLKKQRKLSWMAGDSTRLGVYRPNVVLTMPRPFLTHLHYCVNYRAANHGRSRLSARAPGGAGLKILWLAE